MAAPRLGFGELTEGQAIPETTVNEMARYLEQGAGSFIIVDRDLTAPPGSPSQGACYIVGASATGAWTGHDDELAFYMNAEWKFIDPINGFAAYILDEDVVTRRVSGAWVDVPAGGVTEYIFGLFFTSTPTSSEVLAIHAAGAAFTIPANFSGALQSDVGINPTSTFDLDVQQNGVSIGTISVSTGGSVTATTTSGTSKSIAAGDVLKVIAPGTADATAADMAFTIIGAR